MTSTEALEHFQSISAWARAVGMPHTNVIRSINRSKSGKPLSEILQLKTEKATNGLLKADWQPPVSSELS